MLDTTKDVDHKGKLQKEAAVSAESWPSHDKPIGNLWTWLGYEMPLRIWVGHEENYP